MNPTVVQTSRPCLGEAELAAVARVLAGGYLGMGPETLAFERELSAYLGGPVVLCTHTGTSALQLAVAALGLAPEDEVLVPSLTFVATFQAVATGGARAVACDVEENTGLIDLGDARRRLTPRTRAILPVHYAGFPGNAQALRAFAREHSLRVIEDAAHAFGTSIGGELLGSAGDITCFSFDPIKNITAGQGGAVVTRSESLAERVRAMRNLGMERAGEAGDFHVGGSGWRYQMSDLNAAIGRVQLARFDSELKPRRVALAQAYRERLSRVRDVTLLDSAAGVVPHLFAVRFTASKRPAARAALAAAGFETIVHYKPNHLLEAFRADGCPVAERLYSELASLPLHHGVTQADVERVGEVLEAVLGRR